MGCKSPVRGRKSEGRQSMTVTPIDQVLADGNCGEATNRGEEARVQTCGATNRNRIQGRSVQVSGPRTMKPFLSRQTSKCGARARKVHALIRGDLSDVPGSRACPKARAVHAQATRCWAEVSRRHSTRSDTPLGRGRPKRDAQVRALLTSLRRAGSAVLEPQGGQSSAAANGKAGLDECSL
jgi:hypothetical protein